MLCDKGLCEIAVDKHHLVNIYQSAVAFELICTDNSFFIIYLNILKVDSEVF